LAKLVVAGKFSAPLIGIYARTATTSSISAIARCITRSSTRWQPPSGKGSSRGKSRYSAPQRFGLLRYLAVRVSEAENRVMVTFVTARRSFNEIHHLAKF